MWEEIAGTHWFLEGASRLAQAMCHACLDIRDECPVAASGVVCIEVIEAARKILSREEEKRKKELADRIYSKLEGG